MSFFPPDARRLLSLLVAGLVAVCAKGQGPERAGRQAGVLAQSAGSCFKECHQDIVGHAVMHGPSLRCETCHIQGNSRQHKFYLIASKEELCVRCHRIPHEGVTHAPVEQGRCLECHDPHGSEHPKALVADPNRDLCTKCHQNDFTKSAHVHAPVALGACIVCHRPHSSAQPRLLAADPRALCLTCHAEVVGAGEDGVHVHGAIEQGCTKCHDPHASNLEHQLVATPPDLCLSCHKEFFDRLSSGAAVVHGAVQAKDGCTGCHTPHASKLASLQRAPQPGICLRCHGETLKAKDGTSLTNMAAFLSENPDHHGPIREGNCTACHEAHAGEHFRLLKEDYPPQFYAPFQLDTFKLCFRCHIPDLVLKQSGAGLTGFRDGDRNLHWLHVNREKGRTCRACHEVHASKRPAHIREAVPFASGNWSIQLNFQQSEGGGSCAPGCHEPRAYSRQLPAAPPLPSDAGASQ